MGACGAKTESAHLVIFDQKANAVSPYYPRALFTQVARKSFFPDGFSVPGAQLFVSQDSRRLKDLFMYFVQIRWEGQIYY